MKTWLLEKLFNLITADLVTQVMGNSAGQLHSVAGDEWSRAWPRAVDLRDV